MRYQILSRDKFLKEREEQMYQARLAKNILPYLFIVDPGQDILCDLCNDEISEDLIYSNSHGTRCPRCRNRERY